MNLTCSIALALTACVVSGVGCVSSPAATKAPAPWEIRQPDFQTFTFEDKAIPGEFTAGPGSKLSLADNFFKEGRQSLRWDWTDDNAELRFKSPEAFRNLTGENPDPIVYEWVTFCTLSSFSSWIFSPKPLGGALRMELGNSRFYVNMNYAGWEKTELLYGRDLAQFPRPGTDTLVIRPPRGVKSGTLYFDGFSPRREADVRFVTYNNRTPYVANKALKSDQECYLAADERKQCFIAAEAPARIKPELPARLSADQQAMLDRMRTEFLKPYRAKPDFRPADYKRLSGIRNRLKLKRSGDFMNGSIGNPPAFYSDLTAVGRALGSGKLNPEQEKEMRTLALDMADLLIQQGHHNFYVLRTFFITPMLLLEKEYRAAGRWDKLVDRIARIADSHEMYLEKPWGNADVYNTLLLGRLGVIFLRTEPTRQWQDLTALRHWMDATTLHGEIMPDGTFTHHRMVYSGYNLPAIGPICDVLFLTRGTPFFSEKMYRLARTSILGMSYYANPYIPHMFSGRWRTCPEFGWGLATKLALLAQCTSPLDRECAARYLSYAELFRQKTPEAAAFRAAGVKPDPMQGAMALNYAVSMIQRQGPVLAVVRGQRNGMFANEIYAFQGGNTMGRYLNYGQLQVLCGKPEESGFVMDKGWDFNFWPGTTARRLPLEALRQQFENVEALTSEYFAGAAALGRNGVWAMKLQEELPELDDTMRIGPPRYYLGEKEYRKRCEESRYDTTFRARKSMFFFDDTIVALGSGITSEDKTAPVVTTLAQNSLAKLPANRAQDGDTWLMDAVGNGFCFGAAKPEIRRGFVKRPYYRNWLPKNSKAHNEIAPNEGEMELIYFDHGGAPRDAQYAYYMLLRPELSALKSFAEQMKQPATAPFTVLRHDAKAHIVRRNADNATGYALFESGDTGAGAVRHVSEPCLIMASPTPGKLALSVFNPRNDVVATPDDFGPPVVQRDVRTKVALHGKWRLAKPSPQARLLDGSTLEVTNRDLIPTTVELIAE